MPVVTLGKSNKHRLEREKQTPLLGYKYNTWYFTEANMLFKGVLGFILKTLFTKIYYKAITEMHLILKWHQLMSILNCLYIIIMDTFIVIIILGESLNKLDCRVSFTVKTQMSIAQHKVLLWWGRLIMLCVERKGGREREGGGGGGALLSFLPFSFPPIFSSLRFAVVCPDLAASMAHPSWAA